MPHLTCDAIDVAVRLFLADGFQCRTCGQSDPLDAN